MTLANVTVFYTFVIVKNSEHFPLLYGQKSSKMSVCLR